MRMTSISRWVGFLSTANLDNFAIHTYLKFAQWEIYISIFLEYPNFLSFLDDNLYLLVGESKFWKRNR